MVVTHGALQATRGRCALTIGNFDGVHRGHRALIDRVAAKARELKLASCVLTFEPHPREFFSRDAAPARLTRLRDKLELLATTGIKRVHIVRFDARFASLPAERFVEDVLLRGLGTRWLLVGRDFRFGARRAGDFGTLEEAAVRPGFRLEAMPDGLFDCDQELYGRHLKVCFLETLRDEKKYDGLDALKRAIAQDADRAREYFARHG